MLGHQKFLEDRYPRASADDVGGEGSHNLVEINASDTRRQKPRQTRPRRDQNAASFHLSHQIHAIGAHRGNFDVWRVGFIVLDRLA